MNEPVPESDIRIDRDGVWFYRGMEMFRRDIVRLFYQHLQRNVSGHYFIEIGQQRCRLEVEDTAFVVWAVHWKESCNGAAECAYLLLSDDSVEKLDLDTLRIGKDHIPYCSIKNRSFDARFSRSGYYQLAERIEHDPVRDAYFILLNGRQHYIPA